MKEVEDGAMESMFKTIGGGERIGKYRLVIDSDK
jgi:hypothetical protein